MSNTTTFENAKVNDKIWSIKDRKWYYITRVHTNYLAIASGDICDVCNFDGSIGNDKFQSYFWDEIEIIAPVKPKPKLKVDTKVIVWNYCTNRRYNQYFSHFDATGRIHVFVDGRTSWSNDNRYTSRSWDCWELAEED